MTRIHFLDPDHNKVKLFLVTTVFLILSSNPLFPFKDETDARNGSQSGPKLGAEEIFSFDGAATPSGALLSDDKRLCVARDRIIRETFVGGISLIDIETKEVLDTVTFSQPGFPAKVTATLQEGVERCYTAISRAAGTTDTEGPNRAEVVRVVGNKLVLEDPILTPESCPSTFGPWGIAAHPSGEKVYLGDRGCQRVHEIDTNPTSPTFHTILSTIPTGGVVMGVEATPDGSRLYTANREGSIGCIDTDTNQLGGPACNFDETILVSIGPSGSSAELGISPDSRRLYSVFNFGKNCVSISDIDLNSETLNQEIAVVPMTGQTLHEVLVSRNGQSTFVLSRGTHEILVLDNEKMEQVQRLENNSPADLVRPSTGPRAYVIGSGRRISRIVPTNGPFIPPDSDDGRTQDAFVDNPTPAENCEKKERNSEPNPGTDSHLVIVREDNRIYGYQSNKPELVLECILSNPHPATGAFTSCTFNTPVTAEGLLNLKSEPRGFLDRVKALILKPIQLAIPTKTVVTIDTFDSQLRPASVVVESQFANSNMTSRAVIKDENLDGITEAFELETLLVLPTMEINPSSHDINNDGKPDYIGFPYHIQGLKVFLPLADTNGDGASDTVALDLDNNGLPDPDLPLAPFVSGSPNPEVELKSYFAQFGDGAAGAVSINSQIILFNLSDRTANVTVKLKNDQGNPLTVDLNGTTVTGELSVEIPAGSVKILKTDGQGQLVTGTVAVHSDRAVAGVILFGGTEGTAGVGVSHVMNGAFVANMERNSSNAINTGVALMNIDGKTAQLKVTLCDKDRNPLATAQLTLAAMGHRALFVNEFEWTPVGEAELDLSSFTGLLKVQSDNRMAATVIQTRPGEFSTMPVAADYTAQNTTSGNSSSLSVMPRQIGIGLDQSLYFAQFGDGTEGNTTISSQILLFNLTNKPANVEVFLKNRFGQPMSMDLNGETVSGRKDFVIPAGALRVLATDGEGPITTGSVRVHSDQALAGTILFTGSVGTAGVGASAEIIRGFEAPVESNTATNINTGLAVMNLSGSENKLSVTLCDANGKELATALLFLGKDGHRALFINELTWTPASGVTLDFSDFTGLLKVRVLKKAAATIIRTEPGVFATLPVVPSLN